MRTATAIILAAVLTSACVTSIDGIERSKGDRLLSKYEPYIGEPIDSFTALQRDSWQPISRTQLVLWTTMNDAYLLTVSDLCPELPFAETVGVTTTTSSITTYDFIVVRNARCRIMQIQPIDVERMRADRHA
jgi:Family of unknown function (DUF6491)